MTDRFTCTDFEAKLADLMDGSLDQAARAAMASHRATCAACDALASDLDTIRTDAAALPTLSPSRDLWAGVAERIEAPVVALPVTAAQGPVVTATIAPRRRWPAMAAAASLLVAATAGITWSVARQSAPDTSVADDTGFAAAMALSQNVRAASRPALNETYDREIAVLRAIVDQRRSELDSATVAILDKNLKVIDDAIAESKAALARTPASAFLLDRLTDAYDSKLRTLRAIAAMPQRG